MIKLEVKVVTANDNETTVYTTGKIGGRYGDLVREAAVVLKNIYEVENGNLLIDALDLFVKEM